MAEDGKRVSYSDAEKELDAIVREIESESVDVDILAEKVKRATFLINECKKRLKKAEEDVNRVFQESEDEPGD